MILRTKLLRSFYVLAALVCLAFVALKLASRPVPDGQGGAAADALARRVQAAVNVEGWRATGAVRWNFAGRHAHLWDRRRGVHAVRWGDLEVTFDLNSRRGCAWRQGVPQAGEALQEALADAYAMWVNDSFWLQPMDKFFDPGAVRKQVLWEGEPALLITFTQNGLTPGDSYLFRLDSRGRPYAWHLWTVVPVGGLRVSWQGWQQLRTGAWIASRHAALGVTLELSGIAGAATLAELLGGAPDPFARCETLRVALAAHPWAVSQG